jgi:sulfite exporter TauE/SafE
MNFIWAAIALGFVSSFHCLGMCGPIAMALPIGKVSLIKKVFSVLIYNSGRILTYAILGAIFGILGSTFVLGTMQSTVSILIGILLLLSVFLTNNRLQNYFQNKSFRFFSVIKNKLAELFSQNKRQSIFLIGILNGILPCGMVYLALAGALATGSVLNGVLFMIIFGIGTLTVMLTLPLFGNFISQTFRKKMQLISPAFKIGMATLLILRGLNLGIPFVSPEINKQNINVCHVETKKNHPVILCSKPKSAVKK